MSRPIPIFVLSLRQWLLLFSVLTLLPLLSFAAYAGHRMVVQRAQERDRHLAALADEAAGAVQLLVNNALAMSHVLAASHSADQADLPALYALAQATCAVNPDAAEISLLTPLGDLRFNTTVPLGQPASRPAMSADDAAQLRHGDWVVSNLYVAPAVPGDYRVAISVPLTWGGSELDELRLVVSSRAMSRLLRRKAGDNPQVLLGLLDAHGVVIARSVEDSGWVGKPATASALVLARQNGRVVADAFSLEGKPLRVAAVDVPGTRWRLLAGTTEDSFQQDLPDHLPQLALLGGASILLSLACSLALGWHLGRQMQSLTRLHSSRAPDSNLDSASLMVRELHDVASALASAAENERAASVEVARAQLDTLTGLPLRQPFLRGAEHLAAEALRHAHALAVLYVDLDGFKQLNDSRGHAAGDAALRGIGALIKDCIRSEDVAGRLGGDEFAVFISAPPALINGIAMAVSTRLNRRVRQMPEGIGCSIGIKVAEAPPFEVVAMLSQADAAMFRAKKAGKGRWSV